ncbi:MAG: hypothetical protein K2P17_03950 [Helicobacteraceae bacterium]|nr:hypothetical protein [Helicobacteraceae bacterium]
MAKIRQKNNKLVRKRNTKAESGAENEAEKSETLETPIFNDEGDKEPLIKDENEQEFNTENLKNKTLAELAELAQPYSNRSIETLKRLSREELIYIITNKKDDFKSKEYGSLGSDTKDIIELFIEILNEHKIKHQGRELNALLCKILRKQDKKISEGLIKIGASGSIISYLLLSFIIIGLIIDATIGFDKFLSKLQKKNSENATESKENSKR